MNPLAPVRVTYESHDGLTLAYIYYREGPAQRYAHRVSESVIADIAEGSDDILGLELIGVDSESIGEAEKFCLDHNLDFPHDELLRLSSESSSE